MSRSKKLDATASLMSGCQIAGETRGTPWTVTTDDIGATSAIHGRLGGTVQ